MINYVYSVNFTLDSLSPPLYQLEPKRVQKPNPTL